MHDFQVICTHECAEHFTYTAPGFELLWRISVCILCQVYLEVYRCYISHRNPISVHISIPCLTCSRTHSPLFYLSPRAPSFFFSSQIFFLASHPLPSVIPLLSHRSYKISAPCLPAILSTNRLENEILCTKWTKRLRNSTKSEGLPNVFAQKSWSLTLTENSGDFRHRMVHGRHLKNGIGRRWDPFFIRSVVIRRSSHNAPYGFQFQQKIFPSHSPGDNAFGSVLVRLSH